MAVPDYKYPPDSTRFLFPPHSCHFQTPDTLSKVHPPTKYPLCNTTKPCHSTLPNMTSCFWTRPYQWPESYYQVPVSGTCKSFLEQAFKEKEEKKPRSPPSSKRNLFPCCPLQLADFKTSSPTVLCQTARQWHDSTSGHADRVPSDVSVLSVPPACPATPVPTASALVPSGRLNLPDIFFPRWHTDL